MYTTPNSRRLLGGRRALCVCLAVALAAPAATALAGGAPLAVDFDKDALRARGLDPALADYFRVAARFDAGEHRVSVLVNGQKRGSMAARFDADGQLQLDPQLLGQIGLRIPEGCADAQDRSCDAFLADYPQTRIKLVPGRSAVELLVPEAALGERVRAAPVFERGGAAGLFNYNVGSFVSRTSRGSRRYDSATTELGFNAGGWIVRSRQSFSRSDTYSRLNMLDTFAQRNIGDMTRVLQLGELNVASPLFSGAPILGAQLLPEQALTTQGAAGAVVDGIASSEAQVEIRQGGALLYSTAVPPGPFSLSNFQLLNQNADLEVIVREDGGERRFVVPSTSFRRAARATPGTSIAAGRIRSLGFAQARSDEMLVTVASAWALPQLRSSVSAGVLATSNYRALAVGLDSDLPHGLVTSTHLTASQASDTDQRGLQVETLLSGPLSGALSFNLSAAHRTAGYRELLENTPGHSDDWALARFQNRVGAGLGWSYAPLGSFRGGFYRSVDFEGRAQERITASWSRQWGRASLTATLDYASGSAYRSGSDRSAYVTVSVPLGPVNTRSFLRKRDDRSTLGVAVDQRVNPQFNYRASVEHDLGRGDPTIAAGFNLVPRYTQLGMNVSHSRDRQSLSARLSGGMVLHGQGLTFSPRAVKDTFGIVKVGDAAGVRLRTPGGEVWSDFTGRAVIPSMPAFRPGRVEVVTRSLPRRADLDNGMRVVEVGRGAVSQVAFEINHSRRILAQLRDEHGAPLPAGTPLLAGDAYVTTVVANGAAYLARYDSSQPLVARLANDQRCVVQLNLAHSPDEDAFYEEAEGICRAQ